MNRIILLLLLVIPTLGYAQTSKMRAKVIDSVNKREVTHATVVAYKKIDSSYVAGGLTDTLGNFELQLVPQKYIIEISHIGYQKRYVDADIKNMAETLDTIMLYGQSIDLDKVTIKGHIAQVANSDDKTVYRVSDMPTAKSGTISELLKSLPTLTQDFNGASLINGVPARFFVDGRELSSNELDAYSPSQIEYVEVITNPTSKYDADGLSGIIQLRTKKRERQSGVSSSINLSGTHDTQAVSFSLLYNKDRFSLFSNASVSNVYQHGAIETITEGAHYSSSVKADIVSVLANIGAEYRFNEYSDINLSYQYIDFGYKTYDFSLSREGETDMRGITHQLALTHNYSHKERGDRIITSIYYNQTAPITLSELDYFTEQFTTINRNANSSLVAMVDYSLPFTEYATFEAGVKSHTRNINIFRDDNFTGETISNTFSLDESILGVYILMNSRMDRANFQFGIRGESDLLNQNENIVSWNLFPHISFDYTSRGNNVLKIGYNSRISRPTVADINPFIMLIDPTSQFQGDPNLKPEYSHNLYADYILKGGGSQVKLSAYYRFMKNLITKEYTNVDGGMVLYKPVNISKAQFYGVNATASLRVWERLSFNPNIGVECVELPSDYAEEISNVITLNAGASLALQLKHNTNIGAVIRYSSGSFSVGSGSQSAIVQGLAIGLPLFYSEFSVSKGLLDNRLNLSVRVTDPFNVQNNGFMVYSDTTQRESRYLMQTRYIHFGISYRMNNHKTTKRKYDDGGIKLF